MKTLLRVAFVGVFATLSGCALFVPKETLYLKTAQDRATQEEIRQRLGAPHVATSTQTGDPVWVYEIHELEPGSQNTWASVGSWCDEYVLTFDRQGILRRWTHQSEKHGGEMMPTYCVRDGFKLTS